MDPYSGHPDLEATGTQRRRLKKLLKRQRQRQQAEEGAGAHATASFGFTTTASALHAVSAALDNRLRGAAARRADADAVRLRATSQAFDARRPPGAVHQALGALLARCGWWRVEQTVGDERAALKAAAEASLLCSDTEVARLVARRVHKAAAFQARFDDLPAGQITSHALELGALDGAAALARARSTEAADILARLCAAQAGGADEADA